MLSGVLAGRRKPVCGGKELRLKKEQDLLLFP